MEPPKNPVRTTVTVPYLQRWVTFPVEAVGGSATPVTVTATVLPSGPTSIPFSVTVTGDGQGPFVRIDSPADGDEVFGRGTPVRITVQGEGNITWQLWERLADESTPWKALLPDPSGTGVGGTGARDHFAAVELDPTLWLNGQHELKLTASDDTGGPRETTVSIVAKGQQRIGHLTMSFVDMTIPLAGIPIEIVRTYDSRDLREGDFGRGWTLSYNAIRFEVNRVIGTEFFRANYSNPLFPYTPKFCAEEARKHVVTVTFPDGKVEQFKPIVEFGEFAGNTCNLLGQTNGWVRFVPVGNTRSKLEVLALADDSHAADLAKVDVDTSADRLTTNWNIFEDTYDPTRYRLTTQDGTAYEFERTDDVPRQVFALRSMSDTNGNSLEFIGMQTNNGVIRAEPGGQEVAVYRWLGRITAIADPLNPVLGGHYVSYGYHTLFDEPGHVPVDVLQAANPRGDDPPHETYYGYHEATPHRLERVINPGNQLASISCFDPEGRLTKVCDGLADPAICDDASVEHCTDLSQLTFEPGEPAVNVPAGHQEIKDRRGATTVLVFDGHGNVIERHDPDDPADPDPADPWEYTYTEADEVTVETDPMDNATTTLRDEHGRVVSVMREVDGPLSTESTCFTWSEIGPPWNPGPPSRMLTRTEGCVPGTPPTLFGPTWTSLYDHRGNLVATLDPLDHGTTITPGANGVPEWTVDANGAVTHQTWSDGLLRDETDATGTLTVYDYIVNPQAFPWAQRDDPNGNVHAVRRYDADTWLLSESKQDFNASGLSTQTVDADGATSETVYDAAGRVASNFELADLGPNGLRDPRVPPGSDDTWRQTVTHRDPLGRVKYTQYVFDKTFTETRYDPNGNAIWRRSRTKYTSWNSTTNEPLINTTDVSVITRVGFDRLNRAVKTCVGDGPDLSEPPGALTGWEAGCTWTHFDDAGRVNWRLDERGALSITELDGMGRAVRMCGPFFPVALPLMDADLTCAGQPVTTTHRDGQGRVERVTDRLGIHSVYRFDAAGRTVGECRATDAGLTSVPLLPDPPIVDPDPMNADITCTAREHDAVGQVIAEIDANGVRTEFAHDELGRLVRVTDALGKVTEYGFDGLGNMVTQEDALHRMTHYEFDVSGKRTARELPLGQRETFTYGIDGAMKTRVDFMGRPTTNVDDDHDGRVEAVTFASDPSVTTTYWGDGQRRGVTIAGGDSVDYVRSGEGADLSLVGHSSGTDIAYVHDDAGRRLSITTQPPSGQPQHSVLYDHDAAGRVERIWDGYRRLVDPLDMSEVPSCVVAAPLTCSRVDYTWDDGGRLERTTYRDAALAEQLHAEYTYAEPTGSLDIIDWKRPSGVPLLRVNYALDDETGRREGVTETRPDGRGRSVVYHFDALYRLESETATQWGGVGNDTIAYTYDDVSNRLTETRTGTTPGTTVSSHDANDRLIAAGLTNFTWDANGNLESEVGPDVSLDPDWDEQDRMTSANGMAFTYSADGLKVGAGETLQVVDQSFPYAQVLEDRQASGLIVARYLRGIHPARLTTFDATTGAPSSWWYLHDGLGSTRALVDTSTLEITDEWDYEAFGAESRYAAPSATASPAGAANRWLFAGEERREEIGLDYLRARWMEPTSGRLMSLDPANSVPDDPSSIHRYAYAMSDPVRLRDPSGMTPDMAVAAFEASNYGVQNGTLGIGVLSRENIEDLRKLESSRRAALKLVDRAFRGLGTARQDKWFGTMPLPADQPGYAAGIRDRLVDIKEAIPRLRFSVEAKPGWLLADARASYESDYVVKIYPRFFDDPLAVPAGMLDFCQGGTVLHEAAHTDGANWDLNAGERYGAEGALQYASERPPYRAFANADNWRLFAQDR